MIAPPAIAITRRMTPRISSIPGHYPLVRRRTPRSAPRAHYHDVLLLEVRLVGGALVPLVAEVREGLLEVLLPAAVARVGLGRDRRAVARLEVLAVVLGMLEGAD